MPVNYENIEQIDQGDVTLQTVLGTLRNKLNGINFDITVSYMSENDTFEIEAGEEEAEVQRLLVNSGITEAINYVGSDNLDDKE